MELSLLALPVKAISCIENKGQNGGSTGGRRALCWHFIVPIGTISPPLLQRFVEDTFQKHCILLYKLVNMEYLSLNSNVTVNICWPGLKNKTNISLLKN